MTRDVWQAGVGQRLEDLAQSDAQVRNAFPDPALSEKVRQPDLRLPQIIEAVMLHYGDRDAVAERPVEFKGDNAESLTRVRSRSYSTTSYADLWHRVRCLSTLFRCQGDSQVSPGDAVCCVGTNGVDFATVELACLISGAVSVPLVSSTPISQLLDVIRETRPVVVAVSVRSLLPLMDGLLGAFDGQLPASLLVIDHDARDPQHQSVMDSARSRLDASTMYVEVLDELLADTQWVLAPLHVPEPGSDPLAQVIYTSGATGQPKGAMCTERQLAMMWIGQAQAKMPALVAHYMPMGHVAGRMVLTGGLARGGTTYFAATDDMSSLLDDIALIRPTEVFFIPRVCEIVHDRFKNHQARLVSSGLEDSVAQQQALDSIRTQVMGGRVIAAVNGSAPLDPDLRSFMASALQVPVHDAYGSTEAGGVVLFNNKIQRPPVLAYKLVDVPDLGYFGTDRPHPRGELRLKTASMIPGYFNQPELSQDIFDDEGYYKTGDVMALTGPDELHFVDRTNNVLKLSHAEFVTIARLEALYATSPAIEQIFVHGRNGQPDLLAVIVPSAQIRQEHPSEDALRVALGDALRAVGQREELNPYEIPRDFLVETEPFSAENGLLTGIGKLIRPSLLARYGDTLDTLRSQMLDTQAAELAALKQDAGGIPTEQIVQRAVRAQIGTPAMSVPSDARFSDLGGDSLSAYSLATLLSDIYGVEVPAATILSPTTDIGTLARMIDSLRDAGENQVTARDLHADQDRLRADELRLDAFLPAELLRAADRPVAVGQGQKPATYFLTGANGFLGRFVLLELLRRVSKIPDGHVYCLLRGQDQEDAKARLESSFQTGDRLLLTEFRELSTHLRIVTGDLAASDLGLDEQTWLDLCHRVEAIVHIGAMVNHVLPYGQLFGPNVSGTAQVIKMALTDRVKQVSYVSTVGVADQVTPGQLHESADIRAVSPQRSVHDGYANGYANTKWASEVLLAEASERCQLPVNVFRSSQILAHTTEVGQINIPDMFTRLLMSMATAGLVPSSFVPPGAPDSVRQRPFDGLPADFIAAVVLEISTLHATGHHVFNMVNTSPQQPSMDGIADLLTQTSDQYERLDYPEWVRRLEIALRAQPERIRQHSLLPVLHAYTNPDQLPLLDVPSEKFIEALRSLPDDLRELPYTTSVAVQKWVDDIADHDLITDRPTGTRQLEQVGT